MKRKETRYSFFRKHATMSYRPAFETQAQGYKRVAQALVKAEAWAKENHVEFDWTVDDVTSACFSDEEPPYELWHCTAVIYSECEYCHCRRRRVLTSLGGIDFGRDVQPWGRPYKEVIEAELALESMPS